MALNEYTFHAMGTVCVVSIVAEPSSDIDDAVARLHAIVMEFEKEFSRFLPASSVSALNRGETIRPSRTMLDLLRVSREIWEFSEGYFDPLIDVRTRGYVESFEKGVFERVAQGPTFSFGDVASDPESVTLPTGAYIDFGSVAKGYLADRLADALGRSGYVDAIVNLGGDVSLRGKNLAGDVPRIAVMDATGGTLGSVTLADRSVSTSGSYVRRWTIAGETLHHLKSPDGTAADGDGLVGTSVVHARGAWSDALATALFAMGIDRALEFCEKKSIDALFLLEDNSVRTSRGFTEKYGFAPFSPTDSAP